MSSGDLLLAVFFVLMLVNMAWIWRNPFGERRPDGFFLYLVVFGVTGLITVTLLPLVPAIRDAIGSPAVRFLVIAFLLCLVEELLCYRFGIGIFEDEKFTFWSGLTMGTTALFLWCVGVLAVASWFSLAPWQLYLLLGISGWMNEFVLVPRAIARPYVAVFFFPAVLIPYMVLVYLPYQTIVDDLAPAIDAWWRFPVAILLPTIGFAIAGAAWEAFRRLRPTVPAGSAG